MTKNATLVVIGIIAAAYVAPSDAQERINPVAASKTEASFNAAEDALWRQHRLIQIQKQVDDARKAAQPELPDEALLAMLPSGAATAQMKPMGAPAAPPPPSVPAMPFRLASIWGVAEKYQVFIQTGPMRQQVALGALLPGGWTLVGVDAGSIRVRKGSAVKTMVLGE